MTRAVARLAAALLTVSSAAAVETHLGEFRGLAPVPDCAEALGPGDADLHGETRGFMRPVTEQWVVDGASSSHVDWDPASGAWVFPDNWEYPIVPLDRFHAYATH